MPSIRDATATAGGPGSSALTTSASRSLAPSRCSGVSASFPAPQAGAHSPQSVQRPRSIDTGERVIAADGQTSRHAVQLPQCEVTGASSGSGRSV